jgi:hypothetical protein
MSDNTLTVVETVNTVVVTPVNNTVEIASVGVQGEQGATGAAGATGATGAQGSSGVVTVNAPITNAGTSSAANLSVSTGTTGAVGVLQLTDSISSTSTTTAATPNSVKTAYDLADSALTKNAYNLSRGIPSTSAESFLRFSAVTGGNSNTAGTQRVTYLSPQTDITISSISFFSGTASTSATLVRFGLYTTDGTNLTLVARTASDTNIFSSATTLYTRSLATTGGYPSSYTLTAGTAYYIGYVIVGGTAGQNLGVSLPSGVGGITPVLSYIKASQTDLFTSSTIASLTVSNNPSWTRLST